MRCKECKYWTDAEVDNEYPKGYKKIGRIGMCCRPVPADELSSKETELKCNMGLFDFDDMSAALYTTFDFGCVLFEVLK